MALCYRRPLDSFGSKVRISSPIRQDSADNFSSGRTKIPLVRCSSGGSRGGDTEINPQGSCNRTGSVSDIQGILFSNFPCSKEGFSGTAYDNRLEDLEQELPAETTHVQDGIHTGTEVGTQTWGLDGVIRPQRRLSACPHSSSVPEVPPICSERQVVRVQGTSLWDFDSSMAVHTSHIASDQLSAFTVGKNPRLLRRFPPSRPDTSVTRAQQRPCRFFIGTSGIHHSSGQIGLHSVPEGTIHRSGVRLSEFQGSSTSRQSRHSQEFNYQHVSVSTDPSTVDVPVGQTNQSTGFDQQGETETSSFPVLDKLCAQSRVITHLFTTTGHSADPTMVDSRTSGSARSSFNSFSTGYPSGDGRVQFGLGSPLGKPDDSRRMVSIREETSYKSIGTVGNLEGCISLDQCSKGEEHYGSVRQFDGSGLHQPSRRNKILRSSEIVSRSVPMGRPLQLPVKSQTHSRTSKCVSRQSIKTQSNSVHRMVSSSPDFSDGLSTMGSTNVGSVCYQTEQQAPGVCQSSSGPASLCDRRSVDQLGQSHSLRVPAASATSGSLRESETSLLHHHTDRTSLAQQSVVSGFTGTVNSSAGGAASFSNTSQTAKIRQVPSESRKSASARLETIEAGLRRSGFSDEVAQAVRGGLRGSTSALYDCRYDKFVSWKRQFHSDADVTIPLIAEFLLYLRQVKKLKAGTIDGYKSALTSALSIQGIDISRDQTIHQLSRSFQLEDIKTPKQQLKWNLSVVLSALLLDPFEPIKKASLQHLSWKTAFLLALASAGRVSELHALDYSTMTHSKTWDKVSLSTIPGFVAKNQKTLTGPLGRRCFSVPALSGTLSDGMEKDLLLCPVRSLKEYINRTKEFRRGRHRLFLPCLPTSDKDITKNTISAWLKKTIKAAYHKSASTPPIYGKVSAHEIRAWATSAPLWHSASVEDVISAGYWASSNTFSSYYLRDVQSDLQGLHQLGPFVAAGGVQSSQQ